MEIDIDDITLSSILVVDSLVTKANPTELYNKGDEMIEH